MCSSNLSAEDVPMDDANNAEGQCGVFHGLARLRRCLEASETLAERPINVWIRDIDAFTADTCAWSKEFEVDFINQGELQTDLNRMMAFAPYPILNLGATCSSKHRLFTIAFTQENGFYFASFLGLFLLWSTLLRLLG